MKKPGIPCTSEKQGARRRTQVAAPAEPRSEKKKQFVQILGGEKLLKSAGE